MKRPGCVVRADELESEQRPRFLKGEGVRSEVWQLFRGDIITVGAGSCRPPEMSHRVAGL